MDINSLTQNLDFKIHHYSVVSSTNQLAKEAIADGTAKSGLVFVADFQTDGRGQMGTIWQSTSGQNLLVSIILSPNLSVNRQVYLNMACCLAVYDTVNKYTNDVRIKWPNDIYVAGKKVAGILIENTLQGSGIKYSVVGVGINCCQTEFDTEHASSLAAKSPQKIVVWEVLETLLQHLQRRYSQLMVNSDKRIKTEYMQQLIGLNQRRLFQTDEGHFYAVIVDVDQQGCLVLDKNGERCKYMVKQIKFL